MADTAKQPHRLKSGALAHVFTEEDRRKAAEARRRKREERENLAEEKLAGSLVQAVNVHKKLLDAEQESVRMQAVREVYDRTLGRPVQRTEHEGSIGVSVDIVAVRAKLTALLEREQGVVSGTPARVLPSQAHEGGTGVPT